MSNSTTLFLTKTGVLNAIDDVKEYGLGTYSASIESGQILTVVPTSEPTGEPLVIPQTIVLNFGTDATKAADALLWIDATNLEYNVSLTIEGSSGTSYDFIGDTGYATATKGKKCLFAFTRINANDVLVNKREYTPPANSGSE